MFWRHLHVDYVFVYVSLQFLLSLLFILLLSFSMFVVFVIVVMSAIFRFLYILRHTY